jgi:hypothetical protein
MKLYCVIMAAFVGWCSMVPLLRDHKWTIYRLSVTAA